MFWTIFIGGLLLILLQWMKSLWFRWTNKGIHWMTPWPILGNSAGVFTASLHDYWLDFYKKTEGHKMVGFYYFMDPAILLRDPELIKQVGVTDSDSYSGRGFFVSGQDPVADSIFFTEGEEWKTTRAKMTPYFSPSRIKGMWSIIENSVNEYVNYIETKSKNGPFNVDDFSIRLSTDVIVASAFGLQPDSFVNPQPFFYNLQRELLEFSFALRGFCGTISPKLYSLLGLTVLQQRSNLKLCGFINQVLESRNKGEGVRPDFMQAMFELYSKEMENTEDSNQVKYYEDGTKFARFTKRRVIGQCVNIFGAGSDTTGHTLGFLMFELAINQDIQDRLRKEILEADEKNSGRVGYDELKEMVYMDMVVTEISRKYPSLPGISRKCTKTTRLDNIIIPRGTWMWIPVIGVQKDPKYYSEPEKFNPERFAPQKERIQGTYLPFGIGPRICIGKMFAIMEIKLAVYNLLKKMKVTPCEETPSKMESYGFGIVLYPKNGIKVNAELL